MPVGYLWALPATLVGLVLTFAVGRPVEFAWFDGVIEVVPKRILGGGWISGQTWGWLVMYADHAARRRRPIRVHERKHVRDNFWMGVFFYLVYGVNYLINRCRRSKLVGEGNLIAMSTRMGHQEAYRALWQEKRAYGWQDLFEQGRVPLAWGAKLPA